MNLPSAGLSSIAPTCGHLFGQPAVAAQELAQAVVRQLRNGDTVGTGHARAVFSERAARWVVPTASNRGGFPPGSLGSGA